MLAASLIMGVSGVGSGVVGWCLCVRGVLRIQCGLSWEDKISREQNCGPERLQLLPHAS